MGGDHLNAIKATCGDLCLVICNCHGSGKTNLARF
ncbi:hypothetical protein A1S_3898 [Acinetobacter baumannii ATCC 17978]|nr:hypothetical protein A1S_3898 [Acinetobacter baumannii ATCC 17978]